MQQAAAKIIQSPYSGEYIKPRITTREDTDTIYKEAIYTCPSSGNFVQKVVLSTEPKKKVVNEGLKDVFNAMSFGASKILPIAGLAAVLPSLMAQYGPGEDCDPNDPDCEVAEEDGDLLDDDQVLDAEDGASFISILKGIRNKIKDVSDGKLLVSRSNLLTALDEIDDDIDQILSSVEYNKGEKDSLADDE